VKQGVCQPRPQEAGGLIALTEKFQQLTDAARERVAAVAPEEVDSLLAVGVISGVRTRGGSWT